MGFFELAAQVLCGRCKCSGEGSYLWPRELMWPLWSRGVFLGATCRLLGISIGRKMDQLIGAGHAQNLCHPVVVRDVSHVAVALKAEDDDCQEHALDSGEVPFTVRYSSR